MNVRATLEKLHEKFPNLSFEDLMTILDCFTAEEPIIRIPQTSWNPTSIPLKTTPFGTPDWTYRPENEPFYHTTTNTGQQFNGTYQMSAPHGSDYDLDKK